MSAQESAAYVEIEHEWPLETRFRPTRTARLSLDPYAVQSSNNDGSIGFSGQSNAHGLHIVCIDPG
jgi:hypothetical protein